MRYGRSQPAVRDALLALLVLGLTFLNFGHTNVVFAAGGRVVLTTSSVCGNPFLPAAGDHAPCHVCQTGGGADLPPPAPAIEPVAFGAVAVVYAEPLPRMSRQLAGRIGQPRAPPLPA